MTFAQDILGAHSSLIERIGAALNTYRTERAERLANERMYRRTLSELSSLSPREMADIGISRDQVESIAHEAAFGK